MRRIIALALIGAVVTSCSSWRGIANVPLPGGPGSGSDSYTIYVQMPDTLALNVNSRVRVADVYVGSVKAITLDNWIATLTIGLDKSVQLPTDSTATIGQTSLLGSQHVELAAPKGSSKPMLKDGDTIPLAQSTSFPTTERTLASLAVVLRGGGIPNLEVIQTEANNILSGNAEQIRDFLGKLATFTTELNRQRQDIVRAIDSTNQLLSIVADRDDVLDRVLTEFPPLIKYFADQRDLFADAIEALGRFGKVTSDTLSAARADLHYDLEQLQRPLKQLAIAAPDVTEAAQLLLTLPFTVDNVGKVIRGDYLNISATIDLTLSTLDNGILTGTGFSGALRALEQAWGRDPNTMIPDIRFVPNPNNAPGGPLVQRATE